MLIIHYLNLKKLDKKLNILQIYHNLKSIFISTHKN